MLTIIHYHRHTGQIGAWGDADSESSHLPDHDIVRLDINGAIDPRQHRIVDGELVEFESSNLPNEFEIRNRIEMELSVTDQFMMPDRDVPLRAEWVRYRQALRDLSKLGDVAAQLAAWPMRPDQKDGFKP